MEIQKRPKFKIPKNYISGEFELFNIPEGFIIEIIQNENKKFAVISYDGKRFIRWSSAKEFLHNAYDSFGVYRINVEIPKEEYIVFILEDNWVVTIGHIFDLEEGETLHLSSDCNENQVNITIIKKESEKVIVEVWYLKTENLVCENFVDGQYKKYKIGKIFSVNLYGNVTFIKETPKEFLN